jgi:multisubunit Na+/H+ antiporter MnhB subunit
LQNQTSGGIFTHITPDGGWGQSDTNTETTAFVILGMTSIQNQPPNEIPEFPSRAFIVAILGAVFAASMLWIRRRRAAPPERIGAG